MTSAEARIRAVNRARKAAGEHAVLLHPKPVANWTRLVWRLPVYRELAAWVKQ
jgi:hypothetical protein